MKRIELTILLIIGFSMTLMAQNPFVTRGDMIEHFNISPNGKSIVYREITLDGFSQISMKDLETGKITLVSCVNLMSNNAMNDIFSGADFLADNVIVFSKEGYMVSFDTVKKKRKQLFKLPDDIISSVKVTNDGKGIYWIGSNRVYYASIKKGITAQTDKMDETVISLAIDKNDHAYYTTTAGKVYSFDGLSGVKDITSELAEIAAEPFVVIEAAEDENCFIVRNGKEGVFNIDLTTGKSDKLMDYKKESPSYMMRLTPDGKTLYYNTLYEKRKIRKLNISANQASDTDIQDDVVIDISSERKFAPLPHTDDGIYYKVDELAEFPGGQVAMRNFIDEHFKRPTNSQPDIIEAIVVVESDGIIRDTMITGGNHIGEDVKNEILRVIGLMPKWKPAKVRGKAVPMFYSISFAVK